MLCDASDVTRMEDTPKQTILLADSDVVARLALGEYLRACGHKVLEAASSEEAKAILQAGVEINVVLSDAELAGAESGFALAHWIRRYRRDVEVILTTTIASKAQAASEYCSRFPTPTPGDAAGLASRIRALSAERKRRARPPSSTTVARQRRRRS